MLGVEKHASKCVLQCTKCEAHALLKRVDRWCYWYFALLDQKIIKSFISDLPEVKASDSACFWGEKSPERRIQDVHVPLA